MTSIFLSRTVIHYVAVDARLNYLYKLLLRHFNPFRSLFLSLSLPYSYTCMSSTFDTTGFGRRLLYFVALTFIQILPHVVVSIAHLLLRWLFIVTETVHGRKLKCYYWSVV